MRELALLPADQSPATCDQVVSLGLPYGTEIVLHARAVTYWRELPGQGAVAPASPATDRTGNILAVPVNRMFAHVEGFDGWGVIIVPLRTGQGLRVSRSSEAAEGSDLASWSRRAIDLSCGASAWASSRWAMPSTSRDSIRSSSPRL